MFSHVARVSERHAVTSFTFMEHFSFCKRNSLLQITLSRRITLPSTEVHSPQKPSSIQPSSANKSLAAPWNTGIFYAGKDAVWSLKPNLKTELKKNQTQILLTFFYLQLNMAKAKHRTWITAFSPSCTGAQHHFFLGVAQHFPTQRRSSRH